MHYAYLSGDVGGGQICTDFMKQIDPCTIEAFWSHTSLISLSLK